MKSLKEEFLALQSWEEFETKREMFRDLKMDAETSRHFNSLIPSEVYEEADDIIHEAQGYFEENEL